MLKSFLATLTPMLSMFLFILIGFLLKKKNILTDGSAKTMARLVTWVFYPALSFSTMARNFTINTITTHVQNLTIGLVSLTIAIGIAVPLSHLFVRKKEYERGVYQYALTFANSGYVGDPLVLAIFGEAILSHYKIITLPISIAIYTWGISRLVPTKSADRKETLKKLLNAPLVALFFGMLVGILSGLIVKDVPLGTTAYDELFPTFLTSTVDTLKSCMGPMAMLLAGVTVAKYNIFEMFNKKKVYIATALRLIIIPSVIITLLFGLKTLANIIFGLDIDNTAILLIFFAIATPLGLNTVVFPEAYGMDAKTGASMALISHTLCVITIPLMFMLASYVLGDNSMLIFK